MTFPDKQVSTVSSSLDPFQLFLRLVDEAGEGNVFLLDAAREVVHQYRMSVVGVLPSLEVQVKDGTVSLFAIPGLLQRLRGDIAEHGFQESVSEAAGSTASVLAGMPLVYTPDDPMALLEVVRRTIQAFGAVDKPAFASGLFGYIGFDAVHYLERLPTTTLDDRGLPDIRLQWYTVTVHVKDGELTVYDDLDRLSAVLAEGDLAAWRDRVQVVRRVIADYAAHPTQQDVPEAQNAPVAVAESVSREQFMDAVERAKEYIRAGDIFQVVLSKRMTARKQLHHYTVYERLRKLNPSPYMFMAEYPDMRLFGASPEVQFRSVAGQAEMKPIAGTSKGRGKTPEEDARLAERLRSDDKERAEHVMLVDLCRNDLGRVCAYGSVHVEDLMTVEPYSHLFHLVSTVRGELRQDVSIFHALLATFPAGTLSGAPKIRALEIIDELETLRRGPYGGMIGMIDFAGNANTAIVIRAIVEQNGVYYIQVGAGIVADSDPAQEWLECGHKAGAILDVLGARRNQKVESDLSAPHVR